MVDRTAIKVNQFFVIILSLTGFLIKAPYIVLCLGILMFVGAVYPRLSLFQQLYLHFIRPLGWIKPESVTEESNPHLFAQAMGGSILIISTIFIVLFEFVQIGWALILLVAILALTNLVFGFCAGCFIYFQFSKIRKIIKPKEGV